ncbi:MAG TPA: AMP-dependent synthetase/ligase [Bryobacteraceae bacterium]|nr:AMP-dependent synthetase/ligase [Bryobacteraceae bacterium]
MSTRTVYDVLRATVSRWANAPALHQPEGGGRYRVWTWAEYCTAAEQIAAGLTAIGIRKGDVVGLDSETRAEFYVADLGVMSAGAVAAAVYTSYPAAERARTLRACGAKAVFVEDPAGLRELLVGSETPLDVPVILLTGEADEAMSLDELRRRGREALHGAPFHSPAVAQDNAILYLTSGATGEPKMALVSHAAIVANIDMGPTVLNLTPDDAFLAFLPSAHVTQRVVVELLPIGSGAPVWFSESLLRLPQEIQSVRPTIFVAPPRLWERIHTTIRAALRKRPMAVRRLVEAGMAIGLERAQLSEAGRRLPPHKRALLAFVDRLALSKMRARFGGRMRVCGSGSAPLGKELAEFYVSIGMPLTEGYGLTEGGVVVLNPPDRPRAGSIGKTLPGVEIRLAEDGELLLRSPTLFSGYFNDPETTAQVLRGGWLHTGDLGEIDNDGYLYITGRKKELIVSSNGRKIYPSRIEALFHLEPIVNHVLPIGDQLPYVAALITVNTAFAEQLKGMDSYSGRSAAEIALAPPVVKEVERAVSRVNAKLATFEQIRRWRILDRDFTIEAGELTATLKVRRARALENFSAAVAELYAARERV